MSGLVYAHMLAELLPLNGDETGAPGSIGRTGYYGLLALAVIGLPLWCAARGLLLLGARRALMQRHWQALATWALGLAAAPAGLVAMFAVEALAITLRADRATARHVAR